MVKSTHGGLRSKRKRLHLEVGSSHDLDVWFATRARSFLHNFAALSLHGISVMDVAKCMQHLKNELEVFM
jgi:hypothetical protein